MKDKFYAERDIERLDEQGGYYCRHLSAMTSEGLHGKSEIAAELAKRDFDIDTLKDEIRVLKDSLSSYEAEHYDQQIGGMDEG